MTVDATVDADVIAGDESAGTAANVTDSAPEHDPVNHPSHYTNHPSGIQHLDVSRWLGFGVGNTVKYVWRRGDKGNPAQDLDKSLFYLDDATKHLPCQQTGGTWRRIADAIRYVFSRGAVAPLAGFGLHAPREAAELLLCVADHEPDPAAADFYRAAAAMDWVRARNAVATLRAAVDA
jgi:hypothetical protein